jgi:NADH:ubiquinone oxidoreductase subunit F (NADH-binding)
MCRCETARNLFVGYTKRLHAKLTPAGASTSVLEKKMTEVDLDSNGLLALGIRLGSVPVFGSMEDKMTAARAQHELQLAALRLKEAGR